MRNYAEELHYIAVLNNSTRGKGYTEASNAQSGAARMLNSGSKLVNRYISGLRYEAYKEGYRTASVAFPDKAPKVNVKSVFMGGALVGITVNAIHKITTAELKVHKVIKEHNAGDEIR